MAYSQVDPNINKSDINPADRTALAIKAGYTGYEDYLNNRGSTQSGAQNTTSSGGGNSGGDFEAILNRSREMLTKANEPAVTSLQGQIPEIQKKFSEQKTYFENQKSPLKQRYENLLADVKQQGTQQVEKQTLATAQELGRRGILTDTGLGQREIIQSTQPIEQKTQSLTKDIGLEQEQGLTGIDKLIADLTSNETESTRAVRNAIAQIQAGTGTNAVSMAQNVIQQQQANQAQKDAAARQAVQDAFEKTKYEQVTLPQAEYELGKPYYKADPAPAQNPILDLLVEDLRKQLLGGGKTTNTDKTKKNTPPSYFKPLSISPTKALSSNFS